MDSHYRQVWMLLCDVADALGVPAPTDAGMTVLYGAAQLERFSVDCIREAIYAHLRDVPGKPALPGPNDLHRRLSASAADQARGAWMQIEWATRCLGPYTTLECSDPALVATVRDLGGWPSLCTTTSDQLPFVRQRFEQTYQRYAEQRERLGEVGRHLPGLNNAEVRRVDTGEPGLPMPDSCSSPVAALLQHDEAEPPAP